MGGFHAGGSQPLPFICPWNHGFLLHTLKPTTRDILFVEIQIYLLKSQADFMGVQSGLVDIQLNSGDWLK